MMDAFTDPGRMGQATLIFVAAILIGVAVSRLVPRDKGRTMAGLLASLAFVGVLAYFGVGTAVYILWLFIAAAVVTALFAMVA